MCQRITCEVCGKATWAGCGLHVDQVMAGVPARERCGGHPKPERTSGSFWRRLFGRS